MDYMLTVRRVRGGAFIAEPGPAKYLALPEDATQPRPDHATPRRAWLDAVLRDAAGGGQDADREGDILFYVHGFNTPQATVLARHRLIRRALGRQGYTGAVVSFDWPAANVALNYVEDRWDAKQSAHRLVTDGLALLCTAQRPGCRINTHVLAHSTGAYVVREALDDADDRPKLAAQNWTLSQVMLCSADISARSLARDETAGEALYLHCARLTNYFNPFDSALSLSDVKRLGAAPRAGRVGLPRPLHPKAADVDCGPYFDANRPAFAELPNPSHIWWFYDEVFLADVLHTMRGAVDRHRIATRIAAPDGGLALSRPV